MAMSRDNLPIRRASALCFLAAATVMVLYWLYGKESNRTPVYEWQCAKCQHRFRETVRDAAGDVPVRECPKCGAEAAERIMHYQCRFCWTEFELRGTNATLANIQCPSCGRRVVRDLDHPIPGDDQPAEGGKPKPGG